MKNYINTLASNIGSLQQQQQQLSFTMSYNESVAMDHLLILTNPDAKFYLQNPITIRILDTPENLEFFVHLDEKIFDLNIFSKISRVQNAISKIKDIRSKIYARDHWNLEHFRSADTLEKILSELQHIFVLYKKKFSNQFHSISMNGKYFRITDFWKLSLNDKTIPEMIVGSAFVTSRYSNYMDYTPSYRCCSMTDADYIFNVTEFFVLSKKWNIDITCKICRRTSEYEFDNDKNMYLSIPKQRIVSNSFCY